MTGAIDEIFGYGRDLEQQLIHTELEKLVMSILPSLTKHYSFYILDLAIESQYEIGVYLHSPSKDTDIGGRSDVQQLLGKETFNSSFMHDFNPDEQYKKYTQDDEISDTSGSYFADCKDDVFFDFLLDKKVRSAIEHSKKGITNPCFIKEQCPINVRQ